MNFEGFVSLSGCYWFAKFASFYSSFISHFFLSHQGDGANDVSMIQVADIGIGISGQEGMQVSGYYAPKYHELDLLIQRQYSLW